jgi:hypothetical protein
MLGLGAIALYLAMICVFSELLVYEPRKKNSCKSSDKHRSEVLVFPERNKRRSSLSDEQ